MATGNWYGLALLGQYSTTAARRVDWVTDTIKLSLHTATYTPAQDTDDFFNDATNKLGAGGGYTTGGNTLGTKSTVYDAGTNEMRLIATTGNVWTFTGTKAFERAVIYSDTGGASTTDPLLGYTNLGAQSVTDTTFTLTPDATGWLKITAA